MPGNTINSTDTACSANKLYHTDTERCHCMGNTIQIGGYTVLVPLWHSFCIEDVWRNSALLESGTKAVPQKVLFYGRSNGAPRARFWCHLFFLVLALIATKRYCSCSLSNKSFLDCLGCHRPHLKCLGYTVSTEIHRENEIYTGCTQV